jgi:hypothetical protein
LVCLAILNKFASDQNDKISDNYCLKEDTMNRRLLHLFLAAGIMAVFFGCGNKSSDQACIHQVTMNLDSGDYAAVLSSSCANDMQKGAAYFGLAGFDIHDIINNFSKTGVTSGSTTTASDLNVYMTALVTNASATSLTYMDNAVGEYSNVTTTSTTGSYTSDNYKDAQFYISLVDAVKSLTLIRLVVPNILDANGALNTSCDQNANGVPDDADATACALIASAIISSPSATTLSCTGATYVRSNPVDLIISDSLGSVVTGTYSGLIITMTGSGTISGCTTTGANPSPTSYKRLLYKTATGQYSVATTTAAICHDNTINSNTWPCPIVQNNQPLDLVAAVNETLNSSVSSLNSSLTSSATGTSDVQTAIQDIQGQACCGCTTSPCAPCTTPCTSQDIANYLQTNLK